MALIADLVLQSANNPGTAAFQLIAPPAGRRSFVAAFGSNQPAYYVAHDGTAWEEGYGTVTAGAPDTLSRDAVLANSAGATVPIGFTGSVNIYCELPAARAFYADPQAVWQAQSRRIANLAAATAVADAPRLDQVGWAQIGAPVSLPAGSGGAVFSLPTLYNRFRVEYQRLAPSAAAQLYFRVSLDGGATYEQGAGEYSGVILQGQNNTALSSATSSTYAQLSAATAYGASGFFEVQADNDHQYYGQALDLVGTGFNLVLTGGGINCSGTFTNLLIGAVGQTCAAGQLRLLGSKYN